jgi:pimeloyl-ACP methyl ester carboxylesterase
MGDYDIPASIDYVRKVTGQEKVTYVGHSQGTTQMFSALASNEDYFKDRVNLFVALAPAIRLDQSTLANVLTVLSRFEGFLEEKLSEVGIHELFGKGWEVEFQKIIKAIPGLQYLRKYEDLTNPEYDNIEKSKVFEGHFPHGASVRSVSHFGQIYNNQRFAYFDYHDRAENIKRYGQPTPPEIPIEGISDVPIAMFVAEKDTIVDVKDNRNMRKKLKTVVKYQEIEFDHLSFLLADDMSYFADVLDIVKKHNPVPRSIEYKE